MLSKKIEHSSNIALLELDIEAEYPLIVTFNDGSVYAYNIRQIVTKNSDEDVTKGMIMIWTKLTNWPSTGQAFHRLVKSQDCEIKRIK